MSPLPATFNRFAFSLFRRDFKPRTPLRLVAVGLKLLCLAGEALFPPSGRSGGASEISERFIESFT